MLFVIAFNFILSTFYGFCGYHMLCANRITCALIMALFIGVHAGMGIYATIDYIAERQK